MKEVAAKNGELVGASLTGRVHLSAWRVVATSLRAIVGNATNTWTSRAQMALRKAPVVAEMRTPAGQRARYGRRRIQVFLARAGHVRDYGQIRPRSSLGHLTPRQFKQPNQDRVNDRSSYRNRWLEEIRQVGRSAS